MISLFELQNYLQDRRVQALLVLALLCFFYCNRKDNFVVASIEREENEK